MFSKIRLSVVIAALCLVVSTAVLPLKADAATRYVCGSQCNNQNPTSFVPANQPSGKHAKCSDDATMVDHNYPSTSNPTGPRADGTLDVRLMYSHYCQTMWLKMVQLSPNSHRTGCYAGVDRFIALQWHSPDYACPASNTANTAITKMVDDHSSSYGVAASASLSEQVRYDNNYFVLTAYFEY